MKHVTFAPEIVMETTNYTVMCSSKMKSKAALLWEGKTQSGEKKGKKCVVHVGRKND